MVVSEETSAALDCGDLAVDERLLRAHLDHRDSGRNFHSSAEPTRAGIRIAGVMAEGTAGRTLTSRRCDGDTVAASRNPN